MTKQRAHGLPVKDLARLTDVTIRALHHITRWFTDPPRPAPQPATDFIRKPDLLRLQKILVGRTLGLSRDEIRRSLADRTFDDAESLRRQLTLLLKRVEQTHVMIASIDAVLEQIGQARKGQPMNFADIFDGFDPAKYEAEAKTRCGEIDAYNRPARHQFSGQNQTCLQLK
jgi:DNA-binding transcriptional MerR regulator